MPQSGPRANRVSYSRRCSSPLRALNSRSHWIVQAAQPWRRLKLFSVKRLPAQGVGVVEGRLLKIARRQNPESIENRQIGDGADLSIFVGERAQASLAQRAGDPVDARRIGHRGGTIAAQSDGFEILRSHHRADTAAAGMAPFVADRGEAHSIFAGFADGGNARRRSARVRCESRLRFRRDSCRAGVRRCGSPLCHCG